MVIVFRRCNVSPGLHHLIKRGGSKGVFGLFVFSPPLPLPGNTNFGTRRGILDSWDTPSIQSWQYARHPVPCVKNTLKKQNRFWNCMELFCGYCAQWYSQHHPNNKAWSLSCDPPAAAIEIAFAKTECF